jgi:hypothetical protein
MKDKNGYVVDVGDIVREDHGYLLLVCKDNKDRYYGSLICDIYHDCRDIPFWLDEGQFVFIGLSLPDYS